jgi:N-acyl-D-amino-acid deacylase
MRYIFSGAILILIVTAFLLVKPKKQKQTFDIIIRHGNIYDGSGTAPFIGDLAIQDDTITLIGDLKDAIGKSEIDASGLAVTPGFINMLSWSERSLLMDGRSLSDIKQGVTLEIFGEGESPGPVKRRVLNVDSLWTNLDGYFKYLLQKGVSPNVASFVGATTIRIHQVGRDNRAATSQELENMKALVNEAMEQGAMGLGSSLIYSPATYASTEELIELSKVAASHGGIYITHMRSEGDFILKALNETFTIAREANIPAEIYHLKINLSRNWNKIDSNLAKIDSARKIG